MTRITASVSVTRPDRHPGCVTVTCVGNTILTVSGYCNTNGKEIAKDRLLKAAQWKLDIQTVCVFASLTDAG